jgi:mycothiol synthase
VLTVTILGCAGSYPGPDTACSGYLVQGGGVSVVLDLGPGTLANLQRHVGLDGIDAVVLSHSHPDHWVDLTGLLVWAHAWLQERGATEVRTGASAPRYLWPGVDVDTHGSARALFESAGYEPIAEHRNHRCDVAFRAEPPAGISLRRVEEGSADDGAVRALAASAYPWWLDEVARAVSRGCCHAAFTSTDEAVGFACHSVNRAGWIGPMATDPSQQGQGVGTALLGAVCRDLDLAELDEAEIAWVGPDAFYEKAAGTSVSRRFTVLARRL